MFSFHTASSTVARTRLILARRILIEKGREKNNITFLWASAGKEETRTPTEYTLDTLIWPLYSVWKRHYEAGNRGTRHLVCLCDILQLIFHTGRESACFLCSNEYDSDAHALFAMPLQIFPCMPLLVSTCRASLKHSGYIRPLRRHAVQPCFHSFLSSIQLSNTKRFQIQIAPWQAT